ncbi:MAG: glycosyltransferase family 2 protein [Acidimicrobiales bacterium]
MSGDASGPARPAISVVIASVNGLPYPLACLDSLAAQESVVPEVVLADCTGASTVAAVRERYPDVRILAYDGPKSVPWLRAAGIRAATGRLVAVTEDHCVPRPDWCRRLVEAQARTGWAAVGGGVANASTRRVVDWAVFFCEYSQLMLPVSESSEGAVPGMNVAYDMDALGELADVFADGLWENFLHERMRSAGHQVGVVEDVVVGHQKYFTIPMFLAERFHYSRSYAGMRVAGRRPAVRLAWAATSFALPPLLVARITRSVVRRPRYLGRYLEALPLVVLFSGMWACGEFWGYLTGPGDSLVKVR